MHATEAPPTIDLSSSRKFWCSPMVSSPLSHVRLFSLAFFCSASTQTVLTHTAGSNRVQRSLAVEALNHWTTYKDHASVSYVQFKGRKTHSRRYDNDIDTEHEIETHHTLLGFYGYAHFSWSRALYVAVTWKLNSHALIALRRGVPWNIWNPLWIRHCCFYCIPSRVGRASVITSTITRSIWLRI